jgi:hypothetical protein
MMSTMPNTSGMHSARSGDAREVESQLTAPGSNANMLKTTATILMLGGILATAHAAADPSSTSGQPSAAQIVERVIAARGGPAAWHGLETVKWKGKLGAGATTYETVSKGHLQTKHRDEAMLPFTFEYKRPVKMRLEIQFNGQTSVQVYDGASGWTLRPYLGRSDWEPYTAEQLRQASTQPGIAGYLIDYARRGAHVDLVGTEKVEDQPNYKLKVTEKDGRVRHVWVNARTYLETKLEGEPRKLDGKVHNVEIRLRDYRTDGQLVFPHIIETHVTGLARAEQIIIDSVSVNPQIADSRFAKSS